MAYFEDPAQIKIINFIPVRTLGSRTYPTMLGSYTGLGNIGTSVTVPKQEVQRALIGAGKLTAGGDDGIFGPNSQRAMRAFADSLPESARLASVTWGAASYRSIDTRNMALPTAWASALKLPAAGGGAATASGGAATTGGATTGGATTGGNPKPNPQDSGLPGGDSVYTFAEKPGFTLRQDEPPAPDQQGPGPAVPDAGRTAGGSARSGGGERKIPWPMIGVGVGALALVGIAIYVSRR